MIQQSLIEEHPVPEAQQASESCLTGDQLTKISNGMFQEGFEPIAGRDVLTFQSPLFSEESENQGQLEIVVQLGTSGIVILRPFFLGAELPFNVPVDLHEESDLVFQVQQRLKELVELASNIIQCRCELKMVMNADTKGLQG
ncbi:MAG: hypothetical protein U1C97_00775 [Candidatus Gracilibacteria bacterium]|nr:hypothetical protein [bacterium]MDZ4216834.1 hypothetical protein [Candidatus Gracilibacteria bacterium]